MTEQTDLSRWHFFHLMIIPGNESGSWYVDLKNGSGSCGEGNPTSKPDVTFSLNDDVFHEMFQGQDFIFTVFGFILMQIEHVFRNFKAHGGFHERKVEA